MRHPILRTATLLAGTALVAACGGGSKSVLNAGPNGLPYSTGQVANATTMVNTFGGIPFKGDTSNATWLDASGTVSAVSAGAGEKNATITIVSGTAIDVNTGSGKVRFTRTGTQSTIGGITGDVWTAPGGLQGIFALAGDAGNPTTNNSIFLGYIEQAAMSGGNTVYSDTFLISGFETNPAEITAALPSATYTGPASVFLRQNNASVGTTAALIDNVNGTNITANFGAGTMTGTLSGTTDASLGSQPITFTLSGVNISGNGFAGSFTESGANTIVLNGSQTLQGNFYGQNAAEIGGNLVTGVAANGGTVPTGTLASGFFIGD